VISDIAVCKHSSGWISYDSYIHITQPEAKKLYLIATFRGELHQAYGHVTLTMSAWPKYGNRSLPANDLWPYFGHAVIMNVTWPYVWWNVGIRYIFLRLVV